MKEELEAEAKDDEEVYEQLTCWCETNRKEKETAIEAGKAKIEQLESSIEELTAKIAELTEHYNGQRGEMYKNDKAKKDATGMRMKEGQEVHKEETDLINAINACKHAIVVLSKHHPELLQLTGAAKELRKVSSHLLSEVLTATQHDTLKSFLRIAEGANADSFLQKDQIPGMQSYAPQSGQIFGILKQMKEDFEKNLAETQAAEEKAIAEYESLNAASVEEIEAGKKAMDQAEQEKADASEKKAADEEDLADTKEQLAKDEEFLANLNAKCEATDKEYQERVKGRTEEIAAVGDTIAILNSDESFSSFGKTLGGPGQVVDGVRQAGAFLQLRSRIHHMSAEQQLRHRVASLLRNVYRKNLSDPRLAMVATSVELDAFTKVKKAIDDMVAELTAQQKDEVEHKDWCRTEIDRNERETDHKYRDKDDLETKIADLTSSIKQLTEDIATLNTDIKTMKTEMTRASEDREAENADFQQAVMDQRITQQILKKAIDRMSQVYALLQAGPAHFQSSATDTDPGSGPARFAKKEKHGGGSKVIALLTECMNDSKATENENIVAEQDAQVAYESFMKDSNDSVAQKMEEIVNKTEKLARAQEEKIQSEADHKNTMAAIMTLSDESGDLHKSCDFILKNFDIRQKARAAEIDALNQAKAILSGA